MARFFRQALGGCANVGRYKSSSAWQLRGLRSGMSFLPVSRLGSISSEARSVLVSHAGCQGPAPEVHWSEGCSFSVLGGAAVGGRWCEGLIWVRDEDWLLLLFLVTGTGRGRRWECMRWLEERNCGVVVCRVVGVMWWRVEVNALAGRVAGWFLLWLVLGLTGWRWARRWLVMRDWLKWEGGEDGEAIH